LSGRGLARSKTLQTLSSLHLRQTAIDRLDEIVRRPPCVRSIPSHISFRRRGSLDLFERASLLDKIAHAILNDRKHVTIFHHVELTAHAPMAGNHQRSRFTRDDRNRRNREINQVIERRDLTLNASAVFDINDRKARGIQDVARYDNVGAPKED